jgi:hypothetical protein
MPSTKTLSELSSLNYSPNLRATQRSSCWLWSTTEQRHTPNATMTMDAFQCRLHFTNLISRLTASAVAAKQSAQFALKNRDVDEDLFSVILEQLQSVSMSSLREEEEEEKKKGWGGGWR